MNRWQIAQQVKKILQEAAWADGGTVFADESVIVTDIPKEDAVVNARLPLAIIQLGEERADPEMNESSDLVQMDFAVGIVVTNEQDQWGEVTLLGSNRAAGGSGRGLLEVEERVKTALLILGPAAGLPIVFRGSSAAEAAPHPRMTYVAMTTIRFEAVGTTFRDYQAPSGIAATGGSGQIALTWNAAVRWDARRFILRRAAGATAPATSSDGTNVALATDLAMSKTDTGLVAGTYSYSLFATYDDDGSGTDAGISSPQSVTAVAA